MARNDARKTMPDYELWALLDATGFAISRLRQLELAPLHLTIEQAALLRQVRAMGRRGTVKRIKDATLRQQHTISILVNRMARAGLVAKERTQGERESRILLTQSGRDLLKKVPTASLDAVFAALAPRERRSLACALRSLHEKARSMLVHDTPPFMRYITEAVSAETIEREGTEGGRFSSYELWSSLVATRFAISRLRELELARFGLTVEQCSILKVLLGRRIPAKTRDLEEATLRQHHSISTLVNRMMRMGLVAKERRPGEKSHRILITDSGKSLFDSITTAAVDMTFGALSESEKQRLAACLYSLGMIARNLLGVPSGPSSAAVPSTK
jgi:DNA-binding MarR family transcriptional regulator